jgi:hypothetical protein
MGHSSSGHESRTVARSLLQKQATLPEDTMLWTIVLILLVLWLLGLVSGTTIGGLIHLLLVIAIIVVLIRVISGRRAV